MTPLRLRTRQPRHRRPDPWRLKLQVQTDYQVQMDFVLRTWAEDLQRFLDRAQDSVAADRDPLPELAADIKQLATALRTWADKVEDGAR